MLQDDCRHPRWSWRWCLAASAVACVLLPWQSRAQPPSPSTANNLVYEIFVRSYADGDHDPKGIGDLKGLVSRLGSYLNDGDPNTDTDLEVGVLWLMPIFPSPSYHGYDITDFRAINPDYGTLDDFKTLVGEAHKRGVRIILDVAFNHTSDEHPWFKEAIANPKSPRRKFYSIQADSGPAPSSAWHAITSPSGEKLRYLGVFSPRMPDLDFDNPDVRREVESIATFWIGLGVDGFRLDAAKHLYGQTLDNLTDEDIRHNNDRWREFCSVVYKVAPQAILVGEVLGSPEMLRRHSWGLDALLDEPFMNDARVQAARPSGGLAGRHKQFVDAARALNNMASSSTLPATDPPFESFPFLASHDRNPRLASDFEEQKRRGMTPSIDQAYRVAMYMLLAVGSHPVLYAGDEVMQRGWKWNGRPPTDPRDPGDGSGIFDQTLREPFPWFASGAGPDQTRWFTPRFDFPNDGVSREEQEKPGSMLDLVRGLANLRTRHPAFANGEMGAIASDSADWMVFERVSGAEHYLALINLTATGKDYRFHTAWFPQYRRADLVFWSDGEKRIWKDETTSGKRIEDSVFVPPYGFVLLHQR
jgi:alpha-amylase